MNLEGDEDHLNLENVHTGKKNSEVLRCIACLKTRGVLTKLSSGLVKWDLLNRILLKVRLSQSPSLLVFGRKQNISNSRFALEKNFELDLWVSLVEGVHA